MMTKNDDARGQIPGIIKLIGIGQPMRGDDGAGLAAVQLWVRTYSNQNRHLNIQVELAELPGLGLLDLLRGAHLAILVDAVHSEALPGTVHVLSPGQLESFTSGAGSAHGWGVAETLALGQTLNAESLPQKIILVGIEAGDIALGENLSPEVERALPHAAELIQQLISED